MTDDRARRIRRMRNRAANGGDEDGAEDGAESGGDSTADDSEPEEGTPSESTDDPDHDEPSTESETAPDEASADETDADGSGDGETVSYDEAETAADGSAAEQPDSAADQDDEAPEPSAADPAPQPTRSTERGSQDADATASEAEPDASVAASGGAVPAAGTDEGRVTQQDIDPALRGAIADTSAMAAAIDDVGGEPTVDTTAVMQDTDGYGNAAATVGRENAVFEQGDTLVHSTHDGEDTVQMLEFFLNENRYAVEIDRISAIVEMKDITRFPRGPEAIDGVTDLRGEITGILDPTIMLDVERNELSDDQYIVVLERDDDKQKLGIRVTDVSQAVTYRESQIDETGTLMDDAGASQHECVRGIIKKTTDEQTTLVAWLDIDELIANTE
ncbi:chemotaxis protein CheW [Halopiger djelfimassiliensis]|uniref:chemotaxis protein CheW n=1 Tax=Halopiger djelfimassiliensis TaxID=1293047 RepID=UPI00067818C0|nr:chemotaxis protein CheW [Halopiger djelfimassiliensis]